VRYFTIGTIREAIEHLQNYPGNWLIPAFVLAANDVGTDALVDMSTRLGTDAFLDRYFHGSRIGLPDFPSGNNLLRPRLRDIAWRQGPYSDDYVIRQDTKMWANLYSSRGYRDLRQKGYIEGERTTVQLTDDFQPNFELAIPATFRFEHFLVWLFAFEGIPDHINGWDELYAHLLNDELFLTEFAQEYQGRFRLATPRLPWPPLDIERATNDLYQAHLAPKLHAQLNAPPSPPPPTPPPETTLPDDDDDLTSEADMLPPLPDDDAVLSEIQSVIASSESLAFLLAGPPGTGKTRYARQLANSLTDHDPVRTLFLQFHPAIAYDDFVEGFRPSPGANDAGIRYDLEDRLFLKFARIAGKDPTRQYVAVFDELNRGDVARIFGEFLTYLEPDYRGRRFTLSFSGRRFAFPRNLVVIATANPFDRSVTDLDDALLRRFWVIEIEPSAASLRKHLQDGNVDPSLINRTVRLFELLNETLPTGFGHTNFLRVRNPEDLVAVWNGRIRLGLKRALLHDRQTLDATSAEIIGLLTFGDAPDDAGDPPAAG
jgi:5-methylcytosine-specific restriction protein B